MSDPGANNVFVPSAYRPSHRLSAEGDRVVIYDVELFMGYDASIDLGDSKIKDYDEAKVRQVIERTSEYIKRGQRPKLILGHNLKGSTEPGGRPVIGDIPRLRYGTVRGTPAIFGDIEMTPADFERYLRSNAYPRRSAEIWPEGYMSEVALLAGQTPARPLPDTQFARGVLCFARDLPVIQLTEPTTMTDDEKREKELTDLKKLMFEREAEIERLKAEAARHARDAESKDKLARGAEGDRETFEREVERSKERIAALETQLRKEKYGRKLDDLAKAGYQIDPKQVPQMLDRIVAGGPSGDPETEFVYTKSLMHRDPVGLRIDQRYTAAGAVDAKESIERDQKASEIARDRCVAEGNSNNFAKYHEEALKTA